MKRYYDVNKSQVLEESSVSAPDGFDLSSVGIYPLLDIQPTFDPLFEKVEATGRYVKEGSNYKIEYQVQTLSAEEIKANLVAALPPIRFEAEVAGISVNFADGTVIEVKTDRESQSQLAGAYTALKNKLVTSIDWKGTSGWVSLNSTSAELLAKAVAKYVQACFTAEKDNAAKITAYKKISSLKSFDLHSGWPDRVINV